MTPVTNANKTEKKSCSIVSASDVVSNLVEKTVRNKVQFAAGALTSPKGRRSNVLSSGRSFR